MNDNNNLMRFFFISAFIWACSVGLVAQEKSLKEQAIEAYKRENYPEAIALLEKAATITPDDPEIYYYLGYYSHYNAYDSRPLAGYDEQSSEKIFRYLDKALELNPKYGDAKYFYGAQCSGMAFLYMQRSQAGNLRMIYKKAFDKGAYPGWLLEFGRNMLNSCDPDAILFAGGNADFDVCMYLQLNENFRKDITVVPIGNIDRPWYVRFLKTGLPGAVRKINIYLTNEQIEDIHPFKWDTTTIKIPIPVHLLNAYSLDKNAVMEWPVLPDLSSERKKQDDPGRKRTFLSPQRAILLQIVEANKWERPICFSNGANNQLMGGLDEYVQQCGLVSKLLPFKTGKTSWQVDIKALEKLVKKPDAFKYYPGVVNSNMPRISGITFLYHGSVYLLAHEYYKTGNKEGIGELEKIYEACLKTGLNQTTEQMYLDGIRKMKQ